MADGSETVSRPTREEDGRPGPTTLSTTLPPLRLSTTWPFSPVEKQRASEVMLGAEADGGGLYGAGAGA